MGIIKDTRRLIMWNCEDVNEFLVLYLEGELDERATRAYEQHISRCSQCQAYLDQYRQVIELVAENGKDDRVEPPSDLVDMTLAFIRNFDGMEADSVGE